MMALIDVEKIIAEASRLKTKTAPVALKIHATPPVEENLVNAVRKPCARAGRNAKIANVFAS